MEIYVILEGVNASGHYRIWSNGFIQTYGKRQCTENSQTHVFPVSYSRTSDLGIFIGYIYDNTGSRRGLRIMTFDVDNIFIRTASSGYSSSMVLSLQTKGF